MPTEMPAMMAEDVPRAKVPAMMIAMAGAVITRASEVAVMPVMAMAAIIVPMIVVAVAVVAAVMVANIETEARRANDHVRSGGGRQSCSAAGDRHCDRDRHQSNPSREASKEVNHVPFPRLRADPPGPHCSPTRRYPDSA